MADAPFDVAVVVGSRASSDRLRAIAPRLGDWARRGSRVRVFSATGCALPELSSAAAESCAIEHWRAAIAARDRVLLLADGDLAKDAPSNALCWHLHPGEPASNSVAAAWPAGLPDPADRQQLMFLEELARCLRAPEWTSAQVAREFLERARAAGGIGIFGAGMVGRMARQSASRHGLDTLYWVDSRAGDGQHEGGLPVHAPAAAPPGAPVVLASGAADDMACSWNAAGRDGAYGLSTLFVALDDEAQPERAWRRDLVDRPGRYLDLLACLDSAESVRVLTGIIRFRRTLDDRALWDARAKAEQWFDPQYFDARSVRSLVDCGAYDGDTASRFLALVPDGEVVAIEPDPALAERAARRLAGSAARVVCGAAGASAGRAWFVPADGMSGALVAEQSGQSVAVPVTSVDEYFAAAVHMVKIDVEGHDRDAIDGARQTLARGALAAVAVYHRPGDLADLPAALVELGAPAIGLRHYTGLSFETVAYTCRSTPLGRAR